MHPRDLLRTDRFRPAVQIAVGRRVDSLEGQTGPTSLLRRATLICRAELLADLERTRERHRKRPRPEDIEHDEAMLTALEVSPHAADDYDPPNVYTRAIGINRSEAERMLAFWLGRRHGIKNPKFEWRKTDFCITPTGLGDYDDPGNGESDGP